MLKEKIIKAARRWWHYILSMPERTLRSLAALVGGGSSLLTETLLPDSLRGTTIYTVTVGMLQRFVVEQVYGMDGETPDGQAALSDDYVQRKMAGTALETAGLLTMGFSPLWVLAIAGDVAGG
ncbi:MAG: hypothetical protein KAG66_22090, partial [Methylococcales bacterium]|nr:hypothetical protein [Methylococcales bacterium]